VPSYPTSAARTILDGLREIPRDDLASNAGLGKACQFNDGLNLQPRVRDLRCGHGLPVFPDAAGGIGLHIAPHEGMNERLRMLAAQLSQRWLE
jgi:hypothetical protein